MTESSEVVLDRLMAFARRNRPRDGIQLAADYHSGVGHVEHFRNGLLPRLRRGGDLSGCRVLEVGSGPGFMAALLATTEVGRVVATDPGWDGLSPRSSFLVEAFRAIDRAWSLEGVVSLDSGRPEFNGGRLALVQADGARLPFADCSFDVVFSHGCLEHFSDPEAVIREMLRVLRPGGLLYGESEKFWGARDGSHLYDILPAPWAHLVASAEKLWQLYEAEWGGKDFLWPGRVLDRDFFVEMLTSGLNHLGVAPIKQAILRSRCDLVFWQQSYRREDVALLHRLHLRRALRDWPLEELITSHLAFALRKRPARWPGRLLLLCPWRLKRLAPEWLKCALRRRMGA